MNKMMRVGAGRGAGVASGIGIALNKETGSGLPTLPISLRPGSVIKIPRVRFGYAGPVGIRLAVGVAWKPKTGVFGTDFNNGDNIAVDGDGNFFRAISAPFPINSSDLIIDVSLGPPPLLTVPSKGTFNLVAGGTGEFIDKIDTWTWLSNITAIEAAIGRALTAADFQRNRILTREQFLVPLADAGGSGVDTDADVLDII